MRVCVWEDVCALIANVSSHVLITCDAVQQEKQPVSDNHCCNVQKSLNLNYPMEGHYHMTFIGLVNDKLNIQ